MNTKLVINNFSIMIYFSRLSLSVAAEYKHYYYIYVSTRLQFSQIDSDRIQARIGCTFWFQLGATIYTRIRSRVITVFISPEPDAPDTETATAKKCVNNKCRIDMLYISPKSLCSDLFLSPALLLPQFTSCTESKRNRQFYSPFT